MLQNTFAGDNDKVQQVGRSTQNDKQQALYVVLF